ncbi:hypothetical protein H6P81_017390 [Aristolochia fimbriata]|uniref:Uncharacterized protein n=1 Tax=Aristolochia fimbriata TaxID=158543 RepID=A0AAV7E0W3_ARIFI|nr:hypothetical protein H6P81_017390 [Aristolochia fimbriata]
MALEKKKTMLGFEGKQQESNEERIAFCSGFTRSSRPFSMEDNLIISFIYLTQLFYNWRNPNCKGNLLPGSLGFPLIEETFTFFSPYKASDLHPFVKNREERYGSIFKTGVHATTPSLIQKVGSSLSEGSKKTTTLEKIQTQTVKTTEAALHTYQKCQYAVIHGTQILPLVGQTLPLFVYTIQSFQLMVVRKKQMRCFMQKKKFHRVEKWMRRSRIVADVLGYRSGYIKGQGTAQQRIARGPRGVSSSQQVEAMVTGIREEYVREIQTLKDENASMRVEHSREIQQLREENNKQKQEMQQLLDKNRQQMQEMLEMIRSI